LSEAVYGASEGLKTIVVERWAVGGQAGTSPKIENYLGFPEGISGAELAERAHKQAQRFGAQDPAGAPRGRGRFLRREANRDSRGRDEDRVARRDLRHSLGSTTTG
jgi:hypothetical protein